MAAVREGPRFRPPIEETMRRSTLFISLLLALFVTRSPVAQDCNHNGVADDRDIRDGTSEDCNDNGIPDECDVDQRPFDLAPATVFDDRTARALAAADIDGDGDVDLAAAGVRLLDGGLAVYLNSGDGRMESDAVLTPDDVVPVDVAIADVDGDGRLDLAAVGQSRGQLLVYRQSDDGTFGDASTRSLGDMPTSIVAAHLDPGIDVDLVAGIAPGGDGGPGRVEVFLGRGDGTFDDAVSYEVGAAVAQVVAADVDGDGTADIVTSNSWGRSVSIFLGAGDGTLLDATPLALDANPVGLAAVDVDADGYVDLAVALPERDSVAILLNDSDGGFLPPRLDGRLEFRARFVVPLDHDSDGDVDLLVAGYGFRSAHLSLLENDGSGRFDAGTGIQSTVLMAPESIVAADFDDDGDTDIALGQVCNCPECLCFSVALGVWLQAPASEPASRDENSNGVPDECEGLTFHRGDANADGNLDLSDGVAVFQYLFITGDEPSCLETADSDNDGELLLTDGILILNYLFARGPAPAAPGPPGRPCGGDPDAPDTAGDLGCAEYPPCE